MIPRIKKIQIKNYKSLASVSVDLEPFTVFVGPNGSGKSNLMEALSFVQECMVEPPEVPFNRRGGIGEVISRLDRRSPVQLPTQPQPDEEQVRQFFESQLPWAASLGLRIMLDLNQGAEADYAFEIARFGPAHFIVARERCTVVDASGRSHDYETRNGKFIRQVEGAKPNLFFNRLALPLVSGVEAFNAVWQFLATMGIYDIDPGKIRELQKADPGYLLKKDGANAAAVLGNLMSSEEQFEILTTLMARVAEGLKRMNPGEVGPYKTILFEQDLAGKEPCYFNALNMSDGTLRALGLLLAVHQPAHPPVVGIEEPEATIHPALADVIMEALMNASNERQVLITTHSPDLLNYKELKDEQIRVVNWHEGRTIVAPLSKASRDAVRDHLYMPGELLSTNELNLNLKQAIEASNSVDLFGPPFDGTGDA